MKGHRSMNRSGNHSEHHGRTMQGFYNDCARVVTHVIKPAMMLQNQDDYRSRTALGGRRLRATTKVHKQDSIGGS